MSSLTVWWHIMTGLLIMGIPTIAILIGTTALMVYFSDKINSLGLVLFTLASIALSGALLVIAWIGMMTKPDGFIDNHFPTSEVEHVQSCD